MTNAVIIGLLIGAAVFTGFAYLSWYIVDHASLLNYVTITKGNVIYYLHFSPPAL